LISFAIFFPIPFTSCISSTEALKKLSREVNLARMRFAKVVLIFGNPATINSCKSEITIGAFSLRIEGVLSDFICSRFAIFFRKRAVSLAFLVQKIRMS